MTALILISVSLAFSVGYLIGRVFPASSSADSSAAEAPNAQTRGAGGGGHR